MRKINLLAHLYFPKDFFLFSILVLLLFSSSIVHATSNDCSNLFSKQFKENSPEKFLNWMDYESAKNYIQGQGIKTQTQFRDWTKLGKRPKDFPSNPHTIYKSEWKSWEDFLGNGHISNSKRNWMPYTEAKHYIQAQGVKTHREFEDWRILSDKRPKNFPSNPSRSYQTQWKSWGDFLGNGHISNSKRNWMPYTEAKVYIQSQGIKTKGEFKRWAQSDKKPKNFPSNPKRSYQTQWKSWGDFLGTINLKGNQKNWMDYESAKNYIQAQGIKIPTQFRDWAKSDKRPKNFPSNPKRSYQTQWKGWGDFLGNDNISTNPKKNWMPYTEAKVYIQSQRIKTAKEFGRWAKSDKRPKNFPSGPHRSYQTQWRGWRHFLGTQWANYTETKSYVRALGLKNREEYRNLARNEENLSIKIPIEPDVTYKLEWEGWSEFLGNYKWMSYKKARAYAKQMGIQNNKEFVKWLNSDERPRNFPKDPHKYYSEWKSVEDFLRIKWMPYRKAKSYVQSINIETKKEFFEWILSGKDWLENFPSNPNKVYKEWEG